jgi:hypothetical protein
MEPQQKTTKGTEARPPRIPPHVKKPGGNEQFGPAHLGRRAAGLPQLIASHNVREIVLFMCGPVGCASPASQLFRARYAPSPLFPLIQSANLLKKLVLSPTTIIYRKTNACRYFFSHGLPSFHYCEQK